MQPSGCAIYYHQSAYSLIAYLPNNNLEYHFLPTSQFLFDPLDNDIQMLGFVNKIQIIAADGQHRA
jgi:hypothetical protein